jgi:outer membrane protein OmpA-like peptidoglycan-associated protein
VRALVPLGLLVLLSGCASGGAVTLLPGEAGAPSGAVAVFDPKTGIERGVVTRENGKAALGTGRLAVRRVKAGRYDDLTAFMPPPAHHFVVYFLEGSTSLAPGSDPVLNQMFKELTLRPGAEVEIIGHTDTVGADADNDALSVKRAKEVIDSLVALGRLDLSIARFSGRGERELLVATPDNTPEPANRRVEIVVR